MNRVRKVCFLNLNALSAFDSSSLAPFGGTELQISRLARFLARQCDIQVTLITGKWDASAGVRVIDGVHIVEKVDMQDRSMFNKVRAPFILWRTLGEVDADVYVGSAAALEMGILAVFSWLTGKKFIYRIANDAECDGVYLKRHRFIGMFFSLVFVTASRIVAQADTQVKLLGEKYQKKTLVIKSGFDLPENPLGQLHQKKEALLWIGRCIPRKGPDIFLKVAAAFPEEKCILVVSRVTGAEQYLQKIMADAEKIPNLLVLVDVPYAKINELLRSAKVFVSTAEYEGFPNTFLDACFAHVPLVSLNINPDSFITRYNLGYCSNGDLPLLIEMIGRLMRNDDEWQEKSTKAFKYVMENHSIEVVGNQWKEMITKVYNEA